MLLLSAFLVLVIVWVSLAGGRWMAKILLGLHLPPQPLWTSREIAILVRLRIWLKRQVLWRGRLARRCRLTGRMIQWTLVLTRVFTLTGHSRLPLPHGLNRKPA